MILLLGVSHRTAPVQLRERLALPERDVPQVLPRLRGAAAAREAWLLSTCNRVEVLLDTEETDAAAASLVAFFCRERGLSPAELEASLYRHEGPDAVRHLLRVASGLDSMILGEPQILGQVKRAHHLAREAGTLGPVLERLLQRCLAVAKRVRAETGISRHALSVAHAAVELARKVVGELAGQSVLVVGAGKMSALTARYLAGAGAQLVVTSRRYEKAEALAARFGGRAVAWNEFDRWLARACAVISGTAAPGIVLDAARVAAAMRERHQRPLFLVDVAVPRDVDPEVHRIENVYLYDIDDLEGVVARNLDQRRLAASQALPILEEEVARFEHWRRSLQVTPTIVRLREVWLERARAELQRQRRRLGPLDDAQATQLEQLVSAIVRKMLHRPTEYLRRRGEQTDAAGLVALYREIFELDAAGPDAAETGVSALPSEKDEPR